MLPSSKDCKEIAHLNEVIANANVRVNYFWGAPCIGKSVVSKELKKAFSSHGLCVFGTSELISHYSKEDSVLGDLMRDGIKQVASGKTMDDRPITWAVGLALKHRIASGIVNFAVDGYIRSAGQAEEVINSGSRFLMTYFYGTEELCLQRRKERLIQEGRADDKEETFMKRYREEFGYVWMKGYRRMYLRAPHRVLKIDASIPIAQRLKVLVPHFKFDPRVESEYLEQIAGKPDSYFLDSKKTAQAPVARLQVEMPHGVHIHAPAASASVPAFA